MTTLVYRVPSTFDGDYFTAWRVGPWLCHTYTTHWGGVTDVERFRLRPDEQGMTMPELMTHWFVGGENSVRIA